MNRFGPLRGYSPWEDDLIRSADRQSLNACAAFLCRDPRLVRERSTALARKAKREERLQQRGFVKVDWLVKEVHHDPLG